MARGMCIVSGGAGMQIGDVTFEDKSADLNNGFLLCNGATVSQTQYPTLYDRLVKDGSAVLPKYNVTAYIKSGQPQG